MMEKLRAKFLPPHYLQDNYVNFDNLRQECKSVEEYTREFERHVMICDLRENEHQTIIRYSGGLYEFLRNVVELQHYTTLDEVCALAHMVKLQRKTKLKREPPKPLYRSYPFNKGSNPPPPNPQNTAPVSSSHKPNEPHTLS